MFQADRAADMTAKKKRREMEQASLDAASDLLDTDSNATFAMVRYPGSQLVSNSNFKIKTCINSLVSNHI